MHRIVAWLNLEECEVGGMTGKRMYALLGKMPINVFCFLQNLFDYGCLVWKGSGKWKIISWE